MMKSVKSETVRVKAEIDEMGDTEDINTGESG